MSRLERPRPRDPPWWTRPASRARAQHAGRARSRGKLDGTDQTRGLCTLVPFIVHVLVLPAMQYCAYQQSDQQPLFDKDPGKFEFSVQISSPRRPTVASFLKEVDTFFVQNEANFAIEMNVTYPDVTAAASVPPALCVRVMVCNSDPSHLSEPVVPCSCNVHTVDRSECVCVCHSLHSSCHQV